MYQLAYEVVHFNKMKLADRIRHKYIHRSFVSFAPRLRPTLQTSSPGSCCRAGIHLFMFNSRHAASDTRCAFIAKKVIDLYISIELQW